MSLVCFCYFFVLGLKQRNISLNFDWMLFEGWSAAALVGCLGLGVWLSLCFDGCFSIWIFCESVSSTIYLIWLRWELITTIKYFLCQLNFLGKWWALLRWFSQIMLVSNNFNIELRLFIWIIIATKCIIRIDFNREILILWQQIKVEITDLNLNFELVFVVLLML